MIELRHHVLTFSFPEVHEEARCSISFSRTLRIPDDDRDHPLPPGLGNFPLHHVDDYGDRLPKLWSDHGGVFHAHVPGGSALDFVRGQVSFVSHGRQGWPPGRSTPSPDNHFGMS